MVARHVGKEGCKNSTCSFFSLCWEKTFSSWEDIGKMCKMLCCRGWTDHLGTVLVGPCLMWTDQLVDFHFFLSFSFFYLPHSCRLIGCTPASTHQIGLYMCHSIVSCQSPNYWVGWAGDKAKVIKPARCKVLKKMALRRSGWKILMIRSVGCQMYKTQH